jgi:pSer/pThr/pTyr-binding forkhead associated (FHA) protein
MLDDITVSRRHAEVARAARGTSCATRARSTARTSTTRVSTRRPLRNGDELQVGKFRLVFFELGSS